jgi:dTDP-D-glucose 4,6-dehydratase
MSSSYAPLRRNTRVRAPHRHHCRAGTDLKIFAIDRKGHDRREAIEEVKARDELGHAQARDFSQGFAETPAWLLAREDWGKLLLEQAAIARQINIPIG